MQAVIHKWGPTVDKPSEDNAEMQPYWTKVRDITGGIDAMRAAKKAYLPSFSGENPDQYDFRLSLTKMTNVFSEAASTLAAKPFQDPTTLMITDDKRPVPQELIDLQYNIDGRGNNLTVFASQIFYFGMINAIHWVLIDNPPVDGPLTVAEAKQRGLRPYWVHIQAPNVLEVKTETIGGVEVLTYVRILEPGKPLRVRVFERNIAQATVTWSLYEKQTNRERNKDEWVLIGSGPMDIDRIPLVPFITGRRDGDRWFFIPALRDAVDLQIDLYQSESGLKFIKNQSAYPMLSASGVKPDKDATGNITPIKVGPMSVLYAPPDGSGNHGEWKYIEPNGETLRFLTQDCKETGADMRELMRQPLTVNSENLTVITTAVAAGKTKTLIGAWRLLLIDMLENCFVMTCQWLNIPSETYDPNVWVFEDFDEFLDGKDLTELNEIRNSGNISRLTYWEELKRRRVLSSQFDPEQEEMRLLEDVTSDTSDVNETEGTEDALEV